jgi:hypothetical protein
MKSKVRGKITLVARGESRFPYVRVASRLSKSRTGISCSHLTKMSLMYGKEKDEETGTLVFIFSLSYPTAYSINRVLRPGFHFFL